MVEEDRQWKRGAGRRKTGDTHTHARPRRLPDFSLRSRTSSTTFSTCSREGWVGGREGEVARERRMITSTLHRGGENAVMRTPRTRTWHHLAILYGRRGHRVPLSATAPLTTGAHSLQAQLTDVRPGQVDEEDAKATLTPRSPSRSMLLALSPGGGRSWYSGLVKAPAPEAQVG